jgi:hypothetical protein
LVAVEVRQDLAVAMATPPEGETNEAKLGPALLPQGGAPVVGRRLGGADRQCWDLTQTGAVATGDDHFLVRYHPQTPFCPDPTRPAQAGQEAQGGVGEQDWGGVGCEQANQRRFVWRLTWYRPGEATRIRLTAGLDAPPYPANELLDLSRARWGIEQVFQQITASCHLQTLSGTTPQGTGFPRAFCLLLYNLVQVVRASVATAQARPGPTISTALRFDDVHRQRVAFTELVPPVQVEPLFPCLPSEEELRAQLTRLLATVWTARWLKAPPTKRKAPTPRTPIRGNQMSVYRLVAAYHQQKVQTSLQ